MNKQKWKIIEDFVLEDGRLDSDDFEEFLEVINNEGQLSQQKNELVFLHLLDDNPGLPPLVRAMIRNRADRIEEAIHDKKE